MQHNTTTQELKDFKDSWYQTGYEAGKLEEYKKNFALFEILLNKLGGTVEIAPEEFILCGKGIIEKENNPENGNQIWRLKNNNK